MASLLPNGKQTFLDDDGNPLSNGTVAFYVPGTLTPKDTWQDSGRTILNTNPVELDAAGRAIIYGEGVYRQIVQDSEGNTIWDQLTTGAMETSTLFGGDIVGTPTALVMTPTSPLGSLSNGVTVWGFATQNNGAAATLNVSGLGAKTILLNGAALRGDEILDNTVAAFTYETATDSWHLEIWEGAGLGDNVFTGRQTLSGNAIDEAKGASIAAAASMDLGAVDGNFVHVTGTGASISGLGTAQAGTRRIVTFEQSNTLVYNATSLILPGAANIAVAAGDTATFVSEGSGNWRCTQYQRASGLGVSLPQNLQSTYATNADLPTDIPDDDSIPTITEGDQVLSQSITLSNSSKRLKATVSIWGSSLDNITVVLFRDSTCIEVFACRTVNTTSYAAATFMYIDSPASASALTYSVRVGAASNVVRLNGTTSARRFGGAAKSTLILEEID